jgi:hypothetical protein
MTGHPARQLARMAADAAGELRGYTDPADPFPWELTEDDHRVILPRLHHAIADLAVCIDGIAQATGDEHAKQQLADGIGRLLSGCAYVSAATATLSSPAREPDAEPVITTQPAQLSAADFPAPMTAGVLQAATTPTPQAPGSAAAISPARAPASLRHPGSSPPRLERTRSARTGDLRHPGTSTSHKNLMINCQFELTVCEGRTYDASGYRR